MFFERRCPGCGEAARTVCRACWSSLRSSTPFELHGLDSVASVANYDELVATLVVAAKNSGRRDVLRRLSGAVGMLAVEHLALRGRCVDAVTWVPASPDQRRTRGFDQGRIVATVVAARLGVRPVRLLSRTGAAQRGTGRNERLVGPSVDAARTCPASVVVVDDVITTGASIRRAATELRKVGAERVDGFAFASVNLTAR